LLEYDLGEDPMGEEVDCLSLVLNLYQTSSGFRPGSVFETQLSVEELEWEGAGNVPPGENQQMPLTERL
jgi:hypothetical protein